MHFSNGSSGPLDIRLNVWVFRSADRMAHGCGFQNRRIMCAEYTLEWLLFLVVGLQ